MDDLYLSHHGILGQKWGVRRFQNKDGSLTSEGKQRLSRIDKKYDRLAKKDAKEYARAKMFYGKGAGNRRKLIKNKVEQRSKDNPHYKKAFESYLEKQDMAAHATAAKRERMVRTTADNTVKTGRGMLNACLGNVGRMSAGAAVAYTIAHATGLDKQIVQYMNTAISSFR